EVVSVDGKMKFYIKSDEVGELMQLLKETFYWESPYKKYKFDKEIWQLIKKESIAIDMPCEAVKLSWGEPNDINRTVTSYSVHEQWVYGNTYVYCDDGKVTAWQD
ncbi:MAG: hypothetical protein ACP5SD_04140, partial [Elusimicrobiales bacterium]